MSDSVQPHRRQPTRLPRPWDSPGKNTGVGCHFLLQCMKVKSESEVDRSCLTLRDPMNCSLPGSSVHGIFQARVLEWGVIAFSGREYTWYDKVRLWQCVINCSVYKNTFHGTYRIGKGTQECNRRIIKMLLPRWGMVMTWRKKALEMR